MVKCVLDSCGSLSAVGNGDHHWRRFGSTRFPCLRRLPPIIAQKIVAIDHQVWQRHLRICVSVQIVFDIRVIVDMVEARFVGPGIWNSVIPDHYARGLDEAGLNSIIQSEVTHDPPEKRFFRAPPSQRCKWCGREIVASEDASCPVDPVQSTNPPGCYFKLVFGNACHSGSGWHTPSMMCLVIHNENIPGIRQLTQHIVHISLIALGSALVHTASPGYLFGRLPIQCVPVANYNLALAKFVQKRCRDDTKCIIVIIRMGCPQNSQTAPDRQARRDDQNIPGKPCIPRVGDLVEYMPGNDHGHYNGLAGTGSHLGAQTHKLTSIRRNLNADLLTVRRFSQPDQRLCSFQLAIEKATRLKLLRVSPVLKQALGNARDTGIPGPTPCPHTRPNLVDQRNLYREGARAIK